MIFIATQPLPVSPKQQVGFAVAHGLDQLEVNKQKSEEKLGKKQPLEAIDYDTGGKIVHTYNACLLIILHSYLQCI